jgi:DNA-binding LytR/AlgR family response regulator
METLRIAICEDTLTDTERLRTIIQESEIPTKLHLYNKADTFLHAFVPEFFHLVFLDIYLDGENPQGIEVAQQIRELDKTVRLIFTTTSLDFALDSYAVKATEYLVKPVQSEDVNTILRNAVRFWDNFHDAITVVTDRHKRTINTQKILYIEVKGKQSVIHLDDENVALYTTLDELEKQLQSPPFIRCHRSYIVNLDQVKSIDRDFVMVNGDTVYIRRGDQWKMKKAYQDYTLSLTWDDE